MNGMIRIATLALTISLISFSSQASDRDAEQKMSWESVRCMALNIYHEARGEPLQGKIAVAHVVLYRVAASQWPGQICAVVQQGGERRRYRCQFSWWCDGRPDAPRDVAAWRESDTVSPYWAKVFKPYKKIGRHIFYVKNTNKPLRRRTRG
jgi:spore germination cell wall hydrolase CwlJ-like protein